MLAMPAHRLTACHDCDLLLRAADAPAGAVTRCPRCGAELHRQPRETADFTLALAIATLVVQIIANSFPIVLLDLQGLKSSATLPGTARILMEQGFDTVGVLVFVGVVLAPTLLMSCAIYVYAGLLLGQLFPAFRHAARLLFALSPWAMTEVMMLGIIVAVVKLRAYADVTPGLGLWAYVLFMLMLTALLSRLDRRWIWERHDALRAAAGPAEGLEQA